MNDDDYYECDECGYTSYIERFEFTDEPKIRCPKCGCTDISSLEDDEEN